MEYARAYKDHFSAIIYVNARKKVSLIRDFSLAARRLPKNPTTAKIHTLVENDAEPNLIATAVLKWLAIEENNAWLVIFDNAEKIDSSRVDASDFFDLREFFPEADHGAIIVTTRQRSLTSLGKGIEISPADQDLLDDVV